MAKYEYDKKAKIYRTPSGQRMTIDMVLGVLNGKWGRMLRKIQLDGPTVISVKRPKQQSPDDFTEALRSLADDVLIYLGVSTVLVGVENHSDIYKLGVPEMDKVGWMLKKDCYMTTEKADEYIEEYTGDEEE